MSFYIHTAPTSKLILATFVAILFWPVEELFPSRRGMVARWFGWGL
jgi:hypothetical protein